MKYIQDIEFVHKTEGITKSSAKHLSINANSIVGLTIEGLQTSLYEIVKAGKCSLLIDNEDIFELTQNSDGTSIRSAYAWIDENNTLIDNCTILENLELASEINEGRSAQLLLKQMEVETISDLFPRHLSCCQYLIAGLLTALARGSRFIFLESSFEYFDNNELESIFEIMRKCTDYFNRSVFLVNPMESLIQKIDVSCVFKI
jgi:ABC-type lipoprotein export system ATPase subunit